MKLLLTHADKLRKVREAILKGVAELRPCDQVAMVAFGAPSVPPGYPPGLVQPFTTLHTVPLRLIEDSPPRGESALYDAIWMGLDTFATAGYSRRALLVITDGVDTASRMKKEELLGKLSANRVPVYAIGIGDPAASRSPAGEETAISGWAAMLSAAMIPLVPLAGSDWVNVAVVRQLAAASGGAAFIVKPLAKDEGVEFVAALAKIINAIDHGYTVGVVMPPAAGNVPPEVRITDHPGALVTVRRRDPASGDHQPAVASASGT